MSRSIIPAVAHEPGEQLHGFVIDSVTELPDIKARAYRAHHVATGADLLAVHANDEENLFSVGFRTPPPDSAGVAHILEHSVLAGSIKYPLKDAFNELSKRTLNTFLNAVTWPDRTLYPICSAVHADYFNLAAVYCDLVLHPLITEATFRQEGHHLELEDLDDRSSPLKVTGVVYNEMRGAYSTPERVVGKALDEALLPDTPYHFDSGGDPEVIPELTYRDFVEFHRTYYSPSNARFMVYGDVPLRENLAFLEGVLAPFERTEVDSELPLQPAWQEPRTCETTYPVGRTDALERRTFVTLSWMGPETVEPIQTLLLEVVAGALYGTAAGPLRKALIDSGLGKDVFPNHGYEAHRRMGVCTVGLRGSDPEQASAIENLILDVLTRVAGEGLDRDLIEASFHELEFHGREIVPPFPTMLMDRAICSWYFGGDPTDGLRFVTLLGEARRRWDQQPRLFADLIRKVLLDNPHRLRLVCRPSNTMAAEREQAHIDKLRARKQAMSTEEIDEVVRAARELQSEQQAPDSPEAIASLPRLDVSDIPAEPRTIASREDCMADVSVFEHKVFSNGVGYVGLAFDVRDLTEDETLWLPLLGRATVGMGAGGSGYEEMATRIARHTGGIATSQTAGRHLREGRMFEQLCVDGGALARNASELFGIMGDVLCAPEADDHKRLADLVRELGSRRQSAIVPRGHIFAMRRAAASLGRTQRRAEQWEGSTQVRFLNDLMRADDAAAAAVRIADLQRRIFTRSRVVMDLAGDPEVLDALRPLAAEFLASLPAGDPVTPDKHEEIDMGSATGVVIPAEVNYVAQVVPVPGAIADEAPALDLMANILRNDFLYQKLRVQGGAYGGMGAYVANDGMLALLSYRDPHLAETFGVYAEAADYLREHLTDEAVDESRIGAIASFDRILAPAGQLATARTRRGLDVTDEDRKRYHAGLLTVDAARIRDAALPHLEAGLADAPRAAFGSRERLEQANETLAPKLELFTLGD